MSFGCTVPNRGNPLLTPNEMRELTVRAEEMGFDHAWVSDHVVLPTKVAPRYPYSETGVPHFYAEQPYSDPLTMMGFLLAATQRIKLATGVLVLPYRAPVLTAKIVSTLDYMSGGRVILGIGVGWMEEEFLALGLDTFHQRGRVTNEYIRAFKELWTKDSPEFQGRYCQFSGIKFHPKPAHKPHTPIWVGGNTPPAIRRAARLGDGWLPIGSRPPDVLAPTELAQSISQLRDLTEQAGRPRDAVEIAFSGDVAFDGAGQSDRHPMSGSAEEIAEDISGYQQVGVGHFRLNFRGDTLAQRLENMERFAKEVKPQVAA